MQTNQNTSTDSPSDWVCLFSDPETRNDSDVLDILTQIHAFPVTLKDDKRSLVKQGELFGKTVIAKQPRDKNRRKWIRALSLFRKSEVLSTQETLDNFERQGIESVKPICALEQRKLGFLVDSWLIYEFREGQTSNLDQLADILVMLKKLHENGYRHDDPNFGNFLVDSEQHLFLIDCKGKKRLGIFSDYYDFMLLSQRNEGIDFETLIKTVNINTDLWGYKLAQWYAAYKRKRTEFKNKRRKKTKV